jgi:hypothetical protein
VTSRVREAFEKNFPPCGRCGALQGDPCRTPGSETCAPHKSRVTQALFRQVSRGGQPQMTAKRRSATTKRRAKQPQITTRKFTIELRIDGEDLDEAESIIGSVLDVGTFQDAVNDAADDHGAGFKVASIVLYGPSLRH